MLIYSCKDWLGLKEMDAAGKLHFLGADGDHLIEIYSGIFRNKNSPIFEMRMHDVDDESHSKISSHLMIKFILSFIL